MTTTGGEVDVLGSAEDADPDAGRPRRRHRTRTWLPWTIAVVAVAVAVVASVGWYGARTREAAREDVAAAAAAFVTALVDWDARDGMDDTRDDLRAMAAPAFLDQVGEVFGDQGLTGLESVGAASDGAVADVFVQEIAGDTATVFVVSEQRVTTDAPPSEERTRRSTRIDLERVDGAWLVADVQLLADELSATRDGPSSPDRPSSQPTSPPTGTEPTP